MNAPSLTPTTAPSRDKRILIVDDDDSVRSGLSDVLTAEGYEVADAVNGIQALAALRRQPCDAVLLDINMPLLNGWGTVGELRRLKHDLPVVIITARPDQRTLAREAGVELMEKPLDLPHLLHRIGELLNSGDPSRSLRGPSCHSWRRISNHAPISTRRPGQLLSDPRILFRHCA